MKDAIYFYKEDGENNIVLVSSYNEGDVKGVIFKTPVILERIINDFPKAKDNLYVLIDGVVFKLKT